MKVRIAVVINEHGHYNAWGWETKYGPKGDQDTIDCAREGLDELGEERVYFIEAEVPVPEAAIKAPVIQGEVKNP